MRTLKIQLLGLVLLFLLTQVLGVCLAYIVGLIIGCGDNFDEVMKHPDMMPLSLILSNVLLCAALFFFRWYHRESFRLRGLGTKDFIAVCMLMLPVIFIVNVLIELFNAEDLTKDAILQLAYHPLGIVAIVLIGPFAEELLFRMECMNLFLKNGQTPLMAIVWSSLVFGAVHGNPPQILGGVLIGFILGWLYWKSKSIWVPFAAHFFNNLVGLMLIWFCGDEEVTLQGVSGSTLNLCLLILFSIAVACCLFLYLNKRFTSNITDEKVMDNDGGRF